MKRTTDAILAVIVSVAVFALSSYSNVLEHFFITNALYIGLYFISGLVISLYYDQRLTIILFITTTFLLFVSVVFANKGLDVRLVLHLISIFLSFILGYRWLKLKDTIRIGFAFVMIGFYFFSIFYIYPASTYKKLSANRHDLINESAKTFFADAVLKNTSNQQINPLIKNSVYLIEFYFKNCIPCRIKEKVLKQLRSEIPDSAFKIIYIQDGQIDNYDVYLQTCNELGNPENRFYDMDGGLSENLKISGYPFEIIVDKKGEIRHSVLGYGNEITSFYINSEKSIIKNLLNEK